MVLAILALGAAAPQPALVPLPQDMRVSGGVFVVPPTATIAADPEFNSLARTWREWVRPATRFSFPPAAPGTPATVSIQKSPDTSLGEEGYSLTVNGQGVTLLAYRPAGAFYGLQTLRQLLPPQIYARTRQDVAWTLPQMEIRDVPRFKWRGLMLDVARHYQPVPEIKRFIDVLAMHKMNTFHMHLTDDQGWRVEIKKYPRLTEIGAWRSETVIGRNTGKFDGIPHGGYYTQEELKEIVAYAAERFITVVPEIDMPGHMVAAISAYPELGDGKPAEVMKEWGVSPRVLNTRESTVQFCKDVLDEVMAIFPSPFIHIGGDECPKDQWKNDPEEQQRMRDRGLKTEYELQSWFIRQMDAHIQSRGRRLIGWDEILEGGLADGAAVMSWRGTAGGVTAAKLGKDTVMSPTSHMYLDYYQSRNANEPLAIGGFLPLRGVYAFDPMVAEIPENKRHHVLGVQGNLWTEYMKDYAHVEYMAYPRGSAVAEVGWTPQNKRNFEDFMTRLAVHMERLRILNVNFRPMQPEDVPAGAWTSTDVSESWQERTWDLSAIISSSGRYRVRFEFSHGAHRLDIRWAELWVNGVRASRIEQIGTTGGRNEGNAYDFPLITVPPGAKVMLKASIRSDGGTDSHGQILVDRW
mgnify:CR=1 FL=1